MQHLSQFVASLDFVHAKPDTSWIANSPASLVVAGLSISGSDYAAYLADARELTDPAAGQTISGSVSLSLPTGNYDLSIYSPVTGVASPAIALPGGTKRELAKHGRPPASGGVAVEV